MIFVIYGYLREKFQDTMRGWGGGEIVQKLKELFFHPAFIRINFRLNSNKPGLIVVN